MKPNDVIMIVDPALSRAQWLIGRVVGIFPGRVRTASVRVSKNFTCPVARLMRLPELSERHDRDDQVNTFLALIEL